MSLQARLLAGVALVGVVLVLVAVLITRTTEAYLVSQVDDQLRGAGPPSLAARLGEGPRRGAGGAGAGAGQGDLSSLYVGRVAPDGQVHDLATVNLRPDAPALPQLPADEVLAARPGTLLTVPTEDADLRYRAMVVGAGPAGGAVVVGLPLDSVDATVDRLVRVEVVATALIMAVLGLVTYWVIRLGVRPIKQMTATATAIAGGDLSHRAPEGAPGVEASELAAALNRMLAHLQDSLAQRERSEERLRQFVADASHELRTPVATIRGYAELQRTGALDDPAELDQAMRRTEQEAIRMGGLIDDLLLLARLDQGRPLERRPVDLAAVAIDAAADARAVDPDRPVRAEVAGGAGPLVVVGDEARLRQVVANLVGNALVHTPAGTPVAVRAGRDGDRVVVEVADEGPGMAPEVAARAFERFYRADPSRSRSRGGSGLGLSIVAATVEALGGAVDLRTAPGRGTTVRVSLPAGAPAATSSG